jgi:hypothetical protein
VRLDRLVPQPGHPPMVGLSRVVATCLCTEHSVS